MSVSFKPCLLLLFLSLFHTTVQANHLAERAELLQKKIKALEASGFSMNSVVRGEEVLDKEKYQALQAILAECESLSAAIQSQQLSPVHGNTTQPVTTNLPGEAAQPFPHWSYVYVDFASITACVMSSLAPVVHLIKGWISYHKTGQVPGIKGSSWLIIDFIGKSFVLSFLLVQKLVQNVEITAYNFITPGATLIIEVFVIANTLFFRYRARASHPNEIPLLSDM